MTFIWKGDESEQDPTHAQTEEKTIGKLEVIAILIGIAALLVMEWLMSSPAMAPIGE